MSIIDDISHSRQSDEKPKVFDEEFLRTIPDDPAAAVVAICDRALRVTEDEPSTWVESDLHVMLEAYALLCEMSAGQLIVIDVHEPELNGPFHEDCQKLIKFLSRMREAYVPQLNERRLESLRARFRISLGTGFHYEFTQGDLERIQQLINELRKLISESTLFEADHQRRLLARLEKLQSEIHKKTSDLDRLWGLVGDAGVALGKFGNDVKPIVDRIREIVDIVWRTQARAEELPSGTKPPLIEDKRDE